MIIIKVQFNCKMSYWTSMNSIHQDLSRAQGRKVPAAINGIISSEKPPAYDIEEETEEEYYAQGTTGGEHFETPDLLLIKEMLEMMKGENPADDNLIVQEDNLDTENMVSLSKRYLTKTPTDEVNTKIKDKKNGNRNVAITSILELIALRSNSLSQCKEQITLLKPDHFMADMTTPTSLTKNMTADQLGDQKKETTSLEIIKENTEEKKPIFFQPLNMFKKKKTPTKESKREVEVKPVTPEIPSFTPSSVAEEYYKMYEKRGKMRELINDNIWTRAERQMKEIDEKRKIKAEEEAAAARAALDLHLTQLQEQGEHKPTSAESDVEVSILEVSDQDEFVLERSDPEECILDISDSENIIFEVSDTEDSAFAPVVLE